MALSCGFCLGSLETRWDSSQFSQAVDAAVGEGITTAADQFALEIDHDFTVTLHPGYALAAGRFVGSDEDLSFTLPVADNYVDRYDAVAIRVDKANRTAAIEVQADVVPDAPLRDGSTHTLFLFLIYVRRGATVLRPEDITDVRGDPARCGYLTPLSAVANDVEYVYQFLTSGIDQQVDRIAALGDQAMRRADQAIAEIDQAIARVGGHAVGDLLTARRAPSPESAWLLCDGRAVPDGYPHIRILVGENMPQLCAASNRYRTWMYAGGMQTG